MIQPKIIHVTIFLAKRISILGTDENKFWQIRNTSEHRCIKVRIDFYKRLCKEDLADYHENKCMQIKFR